VTLENTTYNVFVRVRPNMHRFLAEVAKLFEVRTHLHTHIHT
jgi:hypothetical protein